MTIGVYRAMTMTTRVMSVTMPVADQDRALAFYTEVLGCELVTDVEVWPGARLIEVVPPGSNVGFILCRRTARSRSRCGWVRATPQAAYARLQDAGATLHNDDIVRMPGVPPMFFFADPDGNGLVYLQDSGAADS